MAFMITLATSHQKTSPTLSISRIYFSLVSLFCFALLVLLSPAHSSSLPNFFFFYNSLFPPFIRSVEMGYQQRSNLPSAHFSLASIIIQPLLMPFLSPFLFIFTTPCRPFRLTFSLPVQRPLPPFPEKVFLLHVNALA